MSRQQSTREIAIHCTNILNIIHAETPADRVASARVAFDDVCDARDALLANGASDEPSPKEITRPLLAEIDTYEGALSLLLAYAGSLAAAIYTDDQDSTAAFYLDMGRLYGRIINLERARG